MQGDHFHLRGSQSSLLPGPHSFLLAPSSCLTARAGLLEALSVPLAGRRRSGYGSLQYVGGKWSSLSSLSAVPVGPGPKPSSSCGHGVPEHPKEPCVSPPTSQPTSHGASSQPGLWRLPTTRFTAGETGPQWTLGQEVISHPQAPSRFFSACFHHSPADRR